jgi:signal transduction histidine kinase/CheY-like chemotaxis protein
VSVRFATLPIHHKLVTIALAVTTLALLFATTGLIVVDVWRYRTSALDEALSTATVIAENTAAAVTFADQEAARATLESVRVRPSVRRACLYLPDGTLFTGIGRSQEFACPPSRPVESPWTIASARAAVKSADRTIASVYIERDMNDITTRVAIAAVTGLVMLLLSAAAAFPLAHRLHRSVSTPIAQLAAAAKAIRPDGTFDELPEIRAGDDEIGDLSRSFAAMLRRVQDANARLVESNERLQRQEAEREQLLAREREASRLKDEFLAAVSHELRTPLNAIVGWIQILTTTTAGEQTTAKALASIARNAKAQTRVIEDLVDVSRIVTGKLSLRFDPVDFRGVVETAVEVIKPAAEAKGVAVAIELPREPCLVNGDRDRLQQVVWNLLSNAVKFTPTGGRVALTLTHKDSTFELEVADGGAGIPNSFLPHVFDRFRQADGSMTREHGGLGLGLAIVKELVHLHGGSVSAASPGPGLGATFVVRLPQLAGFEAVQPPVLSAADDRQATLHGVHVLAVDDNADALELLTTSLGRTGARVSVAHTGEEALRIWDGGGVDVLVCDLAMPRMNGFEVLKAIRAREKASGRVTPAIALTAHVSQSHFEETRAAGFQFHVGKPFDTGKLISTIKSAVGRA